MSLKQLAWLTGLIMLVMVSALVALIIMNERRMNEPGYVIGFSNQANEWGLGQIQAMLLVATILLDLIQYLRSYSLDPLDLHQSRISMWWRSVSTLRAEGRDRGRFLIGESQLSELGKLYDRRSILTSERKCIQIIFFAAMTMRAGGREGGVDPEIQEGLETIVSASADSSMHIEDVVKKLPWKKLNHLSYKYYKRLNDRKTWQCQNH